MKLAEAKENLFQIEQRIEFNKKALEYAPISVASQLLEESNSLIAKKEKVEDLIESTEETLVIEGNPLYRVRRAVAVLDHKICLLESLYNRTDLNQDQRAGVGQQLESFRSNRSMLSGKLQRCYWETELLDE